MTTLRYPDDVPSGVDFHDPAQARKWTDETPLKRPWRPRFFAAFCAAIARREAQPVSVLELGSGPGHLAREILTHCSIARYVALDFALPMHDLAREHLGELAERVTFVQYDFRDDDWVAELGAFDVIVTLQAAHETRHKRHLMPFLKRARGSLVPGGVMLYSDHYADGNNSTKPLLACTRAEQHLALTTAGYSDVTVLHDEGGMALYAATNRV
jgi:SAM-dependent methyltransferase